MNLFYNSYVDADPVRDAELKACQAMNAAGPFFRRIIDVRERPTFNTLFREMRKYPDDVNVLANADIFFNDTIRLASGIKRLECYALTRWEEKAGRTLSHYGHSDSQDVWVFLGAPPDMPEAEFHQGVPDCDGRLAHLLRLYGYKVTNPSLTIQAVHMHQSQVRNYLLSGRGHARGAPKRVRLGPPKAPVLISEL